MGAGGSGPVLFSGEGLGRTADFSFLSLSLSSQGLLGCFVEGSGLLGCPVLVVLGSLEGASPSPLRPEAGEGLCPVKAGV